MKQLPRVATLALVATGVLVGSADAQKQEDLERVAEAKATMIVKDPGMADWFNSAYGYAIFPNVGKGGLGIGGAHGNGIVFRGKLPVGKTELKQVTIGLQAGGQKFVEVIFFQDQTAFDDFTRGNFEFSAEASAVAFSAEASAKLGYNNGVAIVTMAEGGLMYEASIGGQKFEYEAYQAPE